MPAFLWEDYGHWCFAGFKDVSALLRDKRFGRQIRNEALSEMIGSSFQEAVSQEKLRPAVQPSVRPFIR